MSARELLEKAAKAAGVSLRWERDPSMPFQERWQAMTPAGWVGEPTEREWNPLREDGDAFRLAAKLGINVAHDDPDAVRAGWTRGQRVFFTIDGYGPWYWKEWLSDHRNDRNAATRFAIVRAAAELADPSPSQGTEPTQP